MSRKMLRFVLALLLNMLVVCFIFFNSLQGPEASNQSSGMVMQFLKAVLKLDDSIGEEAFHTFVRKAAHFTEFAALGASLWLLLGCIRSRFGVFCPGGMLFAALATAVTDEFIQSFTGRTSSVKDVLLDFCGALTAFGLLSLLAGIRRKQKEKKHAAEKCGTE